MDDSQAQSDNPLSQPLSPSKTLYSEEDAQKLGYTKNDAGSIEKMNPQPDEVNDAAKIEYLKAQIQKINVVSDDIKNKVSEQRTAAQTAIADAKQKGIELKDGETDLVIAGGKRTRRRRSKTRSRRTKNKRKKQYKR
jgi:hypothetical protein